MMRRRGTPSADKTSSVTDSLSQIKLSSALAIFDVLREGIVTVDEQQRIVAMNQAAVDLLGRDLTSLAGTNICQLLGSTPGRQDCLSDSIMRGQPIRDFQTTLQLVDGSTAQVLIRTAPLRRRDGSVGGVALILGDVTEVTALRKEVSGRYRLGRIIGKSRPMLKLYRLVEDVAKSDVSILIRGESGTGKELIARAIHSASARADGPIVQVNCSALSENLLESELFGHVRGAFTGAVNARRGRFEEAHGGTIFLDEIGDVSPVVQVKLLRVLQERVIERVGDNRPISVNVRIVSATNRDLEALVDSGNVREDFYYRIKVVSLDVPPLRERREDIPLLLIHFLSRLRSLSVPIAAGATSGVPAEELSPEAMGLLLRHNWPGNVRELEHALEHAHVLSRGRTILPAHLPPEIIRGSEGGDLRTAPRHSNIEKELIMEALDRTGWNRSRAARRLGIDRTTLWRKIKEYGLQPDPDYS